MFGNRETARKKKLIPWAYRRRRHRTIRRSRNRRSRQRRQTRRRSCRCYLHWSNCSGSDHIWQPEPVASRCSPRWNSAPSSPSKPSWARTQSLHLCCCCWRWWCTVVGPHQHYASPPMKSSAHLGTACQRASWVAISIPVWPNRFEPVPVVFRDRYQVVGSSSERAWSSSRKRRFKNWKGF